MPNKLHNQKIILSIKEFFIVRNAIVESIYALEEFDEFSIRTGGSVIEARELIKEMDKIIEKYDSMNGKDWRY